MQTNQIEVSSTNRSSQITNALASDDDYANASHEWGIDLDEVMLCVDISEWFDWAKNEILEVGITLPDDETLILLIWAALFAGKQMLERGEFSAREHAAESVGVTIATWCARLWDHQPVMSTRRKQNECAVPTVKRLPFGC